MSVSFDWDFQDSEKSFSEEPGGSSVPPTWRARLRRTLILAIVLCLVGLAIRAWINRRLEAVRAVEDELQDVVELELRNIHQGDAELFKLIQDPAVPGWRARQVARYVPNADWEFVPSARGFAPAPGLVPAEREPDVEQVRVFGDNARVRLTYWFQPAPDAGPLFAQAQPTPWPFDVVWFYRQDEDGVWYHTDPPGDYVGVSHSWHGTWLDVYANRVESEFLGDAVGDMFLSMYHACNLLNCPQDEHYELRFEDAPGPQIHETRWVLPPLYLTGQPADSDTARAAWLQGVKLWLLESLVQDLLGGEGLGDSLVYRYLAARVQAELGLLEAPATDVKLLEQAIHQEQLHPLWSLWETRYDPGDLQKTRLQQAEVAALLQLLEAQVGPERFFQSLPELGGYTRLGDALEELYGLDRAEFMDDWYTHLASLTGLERSSLLLPDLQVERPLSPENALLPAQLSVVPGDQVALNCDGQILVGNVDGSRIVPLTSKGYRFGNPLWSPDGRWLLSVWQRQREQSESLVIMAPDGRSFWFLGEDWAGLQPLGWSNDGRKIYYWSDMVGGQAQPGYWTMDVETRQSRRLPLWEPVFSPDGRRVVYFALPYQDAGDPLWLADVNDQAAWGEEWENVRQLEREAGTNVMDVSWSPDGERLALVLTGEGASQDEPVISVYDLAIEYLAPLASASELKDIFLSSAGDLLAGRTAPPILELEGTWTSLGVSGWSVDGRYLLVGITRGGLADEVTLLVPLDGLPSRVLSFGLRGQSDYAAWSPTDPERLFYIESLYAAGSGLSSAYLLDLESGPIYTTTRVLSAAWSPDGELLAFDGQDQLTVVDREGQTRFVLNHYCDFAYPAWNPAADLALPDVECRAGLDLWLDQQDVYRSEDNLVVTVHNGGDQSAGSLRLAIDPAVTSDTPSSSDGWMLGGNLVVPPCGSLLLRLTCDDLFAGPLTLNVNPLDMPGALPELDYENNQVTLSIP